MLKSHEKHIRFVFKICSQDECILRQLKEYLEKNKIKTHVYFDTAKVTKVRFPGEYVTSEDLFALQIYQKQNVKRLCQELLKLSKHSEKIEKYDFMIQNYNKKWNEIEKKWKKIIEKIKETVLK